MHFYQRALRRSRWLSEGGIVINKKFHLRHLAVALMAISASQAQAENIQLRGFFQAAAGYNDRADHPYLQWKEDRLVFDHNVFALQATGEVAENTSATVQMIARGTQNTYAVNTEWAYFTYEATDTLKVRMGRLRTPLYMYSDFLEVGYAYPWIAPPREVYYIPFNNIEGVDMYKTGTLGAYDWTAETYFGTFTEKADVTATGTLTPIQSRNQFGVVGTFSRDWWSIRMAYHSASQSLDMSELPFQPAIPFPAPLGPFNKFGDVTKAMRTLGLNDAANGLEAKNDRATYKEAGWNIDTGRFVSVGEYTQLEIKDSFYPTAVRYFGMVGVRFGDWLIHYTAQKNKDKHSTPDTKIPTLSMADPRFLAVEGLRKVTQGMAKNFAEDRDVNIYGVRWDFAKNTALKFDYHQIDDSRYDKQNVYTVAVQAIF